MKRGDFIIAIEERARRDRIFGAQLQNDTNMNAFYSICRQQPDAEVTAAELIGLFAQEAYSKHYYREECYRLMLSSPTINTLRQV